MTRTARRALAPALLVVAALVACGGDSDATVEPTRSYTVRVEVADETAGAYRYLTLDPIDIRVGDEVTFEMTNTGVLGHDMNVFGGSGDIAGIPVVAPGATGQLTVLFEEPGTYQLRCYTDDHLTTHRMLAAFDVAEADA